MAYFKCIGENGGGSPSTVGELLFHADDNSVRNDSVGVRNNLTITQGSKFSEYLSYDSTTGRFTVLKQCSLIIVLYAYNNPSYSGNPTVGLYLNGNLMGHNSAAEYSGWIYGGDDSTRDGDYRLISVDVNDYFTLNTVSNRGWAVLGAYCYLMPYFDEALLTKYADS